jgi:hypothetical protein
MAIEHVSNGLADKLEVGQIFRRRRERILEGLSKVTRRVKF